VLRNANTSERLGVTEVTSLGTWTFVLRRPASVPCRVLALEVGGPRGKRSVLGAPADCDRVARAPEASNDAYSVVAGETLQAAAPGVLGNDGDADGDPLSASLVAGVQHGTLSLQPNGAFTYTPATGFSGIDGFTYAASDGSLSATANVELVVTAPPPNAVDMVLTEARWSSGDHKLTAKGRNGPSRRTIDIVAADSGVLLARVDAEGDGQFEVEQRLSQGPCAIQARHRGNFSQPKAVLGAPARCYDDDDDDDD
jgi:hypothetical protein